MDFFQSLQNEGLKRVYLLHGAERFLIWRAKEMAEAKMEAYEILRFSGEEASAEAVAEQAATFSFSGLPKYFVLVNSPAFEKKEEGEKLAALFAEDGENGYLFVCTEEPDKKSPLFKALAPYAYAFSALNERDMAAWVRREMGKGQLAIAPEVIDFLLEYTECDMESLYHEMEKLTSYSKNEVTRKDILAVATPGRAYNIYKISDAILLKNEADALAFLGDAMAEKEEEIFILATVARQFRMALGIRELESMGAAAAQSLLGLKPYAYTKIKKASAGYATKSLKEAIFLLAQTDEALKTGKGKGDILLPALVSRLCRLG